MYRYKPLIDSLYVDSNDYSHPRPAKSAKAYLQSTRNGDVTQENYDALTAPGLDDEYDYPNPNNTNSSNSNNSALQRSNQSRAQSEQHSHYQSPRQTRKLPSPPASPPPTTTGKFKNHTYEPLMPKEDVDTYVYMAPLSDYPELLLEESAQQARRSLSPKTSDSQRYFFHTILLTCTTLLLPPKIIDCSQIMPIVISPTGFVCLGVQRGSVCVLLAHSTVNNSINSSKPALKVY